ncbi:hypothetical protein XELAEV_18033366mg [Xenopus laevis]|uniref:Uncharacterized protein n=1 Tax=Xenopus laevis TaxID=8355 RepID=A0A974CKN3_XENLA|nr:hypothetical protein XELAEV_18033366mg [Xenopus laevis]
MPLARHNCAHLTELAVPAAESSQLVTIKDRKIENGISSPTQSMSPSTQRCAQGRESGQQQQQHVQPPQHPIQQGPLLPPPRRAELLQGVLLQPLTSLCRSANGDRQLSRLFSHSGGSV